MKIEAKNAREYYLVDVIAQILKYLKNELIEKRLKRAHRVTVERSRPPAMDATNVTGHAEHIRPLEATDFDWVITVPAIWGARGKQMMREAGYKVT